MKNSILLALCLFTICLFFTSSPLNAANDDTQKSGLKINLIYKHTGAGLGRDGEILTKELQKYGHSIRSFRVNILRPIREADINIFFEEVHQDFFQYATQNYFIPNPEWYKADESIIPQFDMILCKTREAERIFKPLNPNTVFISFTSLDRFDQTVKKDFRLALHVAGKSQQKGTDTIVQTWANNPHLPGLLLFRYQGRRDYAPLHNLIFVCGFFEDSKLIETQNQFGIHLCPSETEGFGHYLMEALSTGAVVVTTDAPPMNEFVLDKRCLAGYNRTQAQHLATNYYVDGSKLAEVAETLMYLSDEELQDIGKKNREFYLKNKLFFEHRIAEIFGNIN